HRTAQDVPIFCSLHPQSRLHRSRPPHAVPDIPPPRCYHVTRKRGTILTHCIQHLQDLLEDALTKRWGIQQATCRPECVHAADEVEGTQVPVEDLPIIAHLAND